MTRIIHLPKETAMYIGSFDPFTLGHLSIVEKALHAVRVTCPDLNSGEVTKLPRYDKLIICIGKNAGKTPYWEANERKHFIELALKNHPRAKDITVIAEYGMTVDIAYRYGVTTLIRGIRTDSTDLYSEKQLAETNRLLAATRGFTLETTFIEQHDPFLQTVSSSLVRELYKMNELIVLARCLPKPIAEEIISEKLFEQRFSRLFNPEVVTLPYWCQLKEAYAARPYHNMIHLAYMFNQLAIYQQHCGDEEGYINSDENLNLAIFLHDYVYDAQSEHNEANSADIVVKWDRQRILDQNISAITVHRLILATTHGQKSNWTKKEKLIADLDLSILGTADYLTYQNYANAIREEYADYSDEEYKKGRLKFLFALLKKKHIFHLEFFRKMFEKKARQNIAKEIKCLNGIA